MRLLLLPLVSLWLRTLPYTIYMTTRPVPQSNALLRARFLASGQFRYCRHHCRCCCWRCSCCQLVVCAAATQDAPITFHCPLRWNEHICLAEYRRDTGHRGPGKQGEGYNPSCLFFFFLSTVSPIRGIRTAGRLSMGLSSVRDIDEAVFH